MRIGWLSVCIGVSVLGTNGVVDRGRSGLNQLSFAWRNGILVWMKQEDKFIIGMSGGGLFGGMVVGLALGMNPYIDDIPQ